ncbi:MAG: hypothetical protein IPJ19_06780 [Planctomycetes bacterium]|nr:hypothetical protein [Planctomycetota bacterium]
MSEQQTLTPERWKRFQVDQQVLMISNEMHRGMHSFAPEHRASLQLCYERVLHMLGLTIGAAGSKGLRRELLRWHEVVGALYLEERSDPDQHRSALRVLLQLRPALAPQVEALGL